VLPRTKIDPIANLKMGAAFLVAAFLAAYFWEPTHDLLQFAACGALSLMALLFVLDALPIDYLDEEAMRRLLQSLSSWALNLRLIIGLLFALCLAYLLGTGLVKLTPELLGNGPQPLWITVLLIGLWIGCVVGIAGALYVIVQSLKVAWFSCRDGNAFSTVTHLPPLADPIGPGRSSHQAASAARTLNGDRLWAQRIDPPNSGIEPWPRRRP
jgi:hypothetical protein